MPRRPSHEKYTAEAQADLVTDLPGWEDDSFNIFSGYGQIYRSLLHCKIRVELHEMMKACGAGTSRSARQPAGRCSMYSWSLLVIHHQTLWFYG